MNKKGFAISIILYSIVFLVVSILYITLGIMKTRYTVCNGLRETIRKELNEVYNNVNNNIVDDDNIENNGD